MGDARQWDEAAYRRRLLSDRRLSHRTIFRAVFASSDLNRNPDNTPPLPDNVVTASSDGSIAAYSLQQQQNSHLDRRKGVHPALEPLCIIQGHRGPAYDLQFFGDDTDALLFSGGDDGHIKAWRWIDVLDCKPGDPTDPVLDIVNPQHEDSWGARSPIPETNAVSVYEQEGCIFSAAGDGCAYAWDVATGKCKTVFKGHQDYLHCVRVCKLTNQIVTGSEDGTARIWDCRSGKCTNVICPDKNHKSPQNSWISCVGVDPTESWLGCGSSRGLSVWSLVSNECVFNIECPSPTRDVLFDNNQILAVGGEPVLSRYSINGSLVSQMKCAPSSPFSVSLHPSGVVAIGGYGGVVDILSEYGSHLSTFSCEGFIEVA